MSVPTTIQAKSIPLQVSEDGITWLSVLCKRAFNFNATKAVNTEETDCGIDKGLGARDWTADFQGVVNTTPTTGSEVSAKQMMDYYNNDTLLYIKWLTGDGSGNNLFRSGRAYITDYAEQYQTGNLIAFTFTANGVGDVDTTV